MSSTLSHLSGPQCELRNRATINGGIEIGRHPEVVQVTLLSPTERLQQRGLLGIAQSQYL